MATMTTRPTQASIIATSSPTAETDATELPVSRSSATRGGQPVAAYNYAQVQNQVWHWKRNDSGLDFP